MEQLKAMKQQLTSTVQGQLGHLESVDAKELGEVVDMIKDLAEAIYYCTITEAMETGEKEKQGTNNYYYTERYLPPMEERMYYGSQTSGSGMGSNGSNGGNSNGSRYYSSRDRMMREYEYPMYMDMHDPKEGKSAMSRKNYMESKEAHQTKETRMKDLEKYIQELGHDITEMIEDATPEEKQLLKQKMATLATKIT